MKESPAATVGEAGPRSVGHGRGGGPWNREGAGGRRPGAGRRARDAERGGRPEARGGATGPPRGEERVAGGQGGGGWVDGADAAAAVNAAAR